MTLPAGAWHLLTSGNVAAVPEDSGVYLLGEVGAPDRAVFYVGQAAGLGSRLAGHLEEGESDCLGAHLGKVVSFAYWTVEGGETARLEEQARLIRQYRPECSD